MDEQKLDETPKKDVAIEEDTFEAPPKEAKPQEAPPKKMSKPVQANIIDTDEQNLTKMIDTYLELIKDSTSGTKKNKEALLTLIRIVKLLIKKNRPDLYKLVFEKLFRKNHNHMVVPTVVFQYLHEIRDTDKSKVEILYTTMSTLAYYLRQPKKTSFPLSLDEIETRYDHPSLSEFISTYIR